MSKAPAGIVEQALRLVDAARLLPADEAAQALEQVAIVMQAAQAQVLVAAERSGEIKDSGCRTVRSFAATILRRSPEDASQVARVAHHLVAFPKLANAYKAGRVHTANMRAILTHLSPCGLEVLQTYEDSLLDLGLPAGPKEIHTFCRELAAVHKPDRERDKVNAQGGRLVRVRRVGDLAHLDAMVDPVLGDQLKATLAATAKASRTPDDPRSHAERSADALEDLLRQGMDHADCQQTPSRGRPHATISVQLETLLGMGQQGPAILSRFGLIPASTAARVTCDAVVRLVVKHGQRVLNVGRSRRVVSPRQRAALAERYQRCVVPGCGVRLADCDIHHLWWWSLSGPTDLDLQIPVCSSHHIWLHEGGYTITREDDQLVFRDPKGRVIANIDHVLQHQLDLLHQVQAHPPEQPAAAEAADAIVQDLAAWTDSRYRHGRWGRTGQDPAPPPGHAPPQPA